MAGSAALGAAATSQGGDGATTPWLLRLYIAGETCKSLTALSNLHRICGEYLAERHQIEVIDLLQTPQLAEKDRIVAIPTLVRLQPEPARKIIGDLSDLKKTLSGLQLMPPAT